MAPPTCAHAVVVEVVVTKERPAHGGCFCLNCSRSKKGELLLKAILSNLHVLKYNLADGKLLVAGTG